MAEENKKNEDVVIDDPTDENKQPEPEPAEPAEETFTKSEMEKIIQDRVARANKAADQKVKEAERLAKMNEEERAEAKRKALEGELAEYKRKEQRFELSKEASKMLTESKINADDALVDILVTDDAETTSEAVNSFIKLFNTVVEQGVKESLTGTTPKANPKGGNTVTPEDFKKMGYLERVEFKNANPKLYEQYTKQGD